MEDPLQGLLSADHPVSPTAGVWGEADPVEGLNVLGWFLGGGDSVTRRSASSRFVPPFGGIPR
jgi:hypothetical protein